MLFFFQAEDGIRDRNVTGVQTCALPIPSRQVRKKLWPPLTVMKWGGPCCPGRAKLCGSSVITLIASPISRSTRCSAFTKLLVHRSEEHTSELQSRFELVCRLLLAKKTW